MFLNEYHHVSQECDANVLHLHKKGFFSLWLLS